MAEENVNNELTETTDEDYTESGTIINVDQMQSIDINQRFTRVKTDDGWIIRMLEAGRVTVNFITSMRKFETALMVGDTVERDGNNLIINRYQPSDNYRAQRGTSSLALTREQTVGPKPSDQ